jgi:hypothetical protein
MTNNSRSCTGRRVAESKEKAGHVVVMLGRWDGAAGDPVEEISVCAFEQCLVAVELALVKLGEMGIGKAAENEVTFPRPAMPGTEREPLAADVR